MGNEKISKAGPSESARPTDKRAEPVSAFEATPILGAPIQQLSTVQRLHGLIGNQAVQRLIAQAPKGPAVLESNPDNNMSTDPALAMANTPNMSVDPAQAMPGASNMSMDSSSMIPGAPNMSMDPAQGMPDTSNMSMSPNGPISLPDMPDMPNMSVDTNGPAPAQTPGVQPNQSIDPNAPTQTPGAQPNQSIDPNAPAPAQTPGVQPNQSIDPNAPVQTPGAQPNQSIDPNAPAPAQTPGAQPNQSIDPNAPAPAQTPGAQPNQSIDPNAPAPAQTPGAQPNQSIDPNMPAPANQQVNSSQPTGAAKPAAPSEPTTATVGPNPAAPQSNEPEDPQPAAPQAATPNTPALVNSELAEHQRWGKMGQANSADRALFIADAVGKGEMQGLTEGAAMGLGVGLGTRATVYGVGKAAAKWGPLIASNSKNFIPVPAVGAIIGGAFAVNSLLTRKWGEAWTDITNFTEGEGDYEPIANKLQAVSTALDIAANVANTIAGIMGLISAGMWLGAVLTAGVLSPLAATLSSIAAVIGVVANVVDVVNQGILQPAIVMFRSLQAFKSQSEPKKIAELGGKLSEAAAGPASALSAYAGGKLADAGGKKKKPKGDPADPTAKPEPEITPAANGPEITAKEPIVNPESWAGKKLRALGNWRGVEANKPTSSAAPAADASVTAPKADAPAADTSVDTAAPKSDTPVADAPAPDAPALTADTPAPVADTPAPKADENGQLSMFDEPTGPKTDENGQMDLFANLDAPVEVVASPKNADNGQMDLFPPPAAPDPVQMDLPGVDMTPTGPQAPGAYVPQGVQPDVTFHLADPRDARVAGQAIPGPKDVGFSGKHNQQAKRGNSQISEHVVPGAQWEAINNPRTASGKRKKKKAFYRSQKSGPYNNDTTLRVEKGVAEAKTTGLANNDNARTEAIKTAIEQGVPINIINDMLLPSIEATMQARDATPGSTLTDGQIVAAAIGQLGAKFEMGVNHNYKKKKHNKNSELRAVGNEVGADKIDDIDWDATFGLNTPDVPTPLAPAPRPMEQMTLPGVNTPNQFPMQGPTPSNLKLSYPNTAPSAEPGVSELGGAFRIESGQQPEGGYPFKDLSDAEIDAGVSGLDALSKGEQPGGASVVAGDFHQVDIAPMEPKMPFSQEQLDAMSPADRAAKEGLPSKDKDSGPNKWRHPLSPPSPFAWNTPGAPAVGNGGYHGAQGNTTQKRDANGNPVFDDQGKPVYQYNPAEISFVTPPGKQYVVRTGGPGSYIDHIFASKQEAIAYAQLMASRGEMSARQTSALPTAWPGTPGKPAVPNSGNNTADYSVYEINAGTAGNAAEGLPATGKLANFSPIAPQPESFPGNGYPSSYTGGGPQIQLPYGTIGGKTSMSDAPGAGPAEFPITDRVTPPPAPSSAPQTPEQLVIPGLGLDPAAAKVDAPAAAPTEQVAVPAASVDQSAPAPVAPVEQTSSSTGSSVQQTVTAAAAASGPDQATRDRRNARADRWMGRADWVEKKVWKGLREKTPDSRSDVVAEALGYKEPEKKEEEAEKERKTVTIPVVPNYTPPPGTPADVEAVEGEICQLDSKENEASQLQSTAKREVKEGEKNQSTMEDVVSQTNTSIANTQQHAQETNTRKAANQSANEKQQETQQTTAGFGERTAGLKTLKGMLWGFLKVLPVAQHIPSESARKTAVRMGGDAQAFLDRLGEAEGAMAGINAGHGARKAELQQDKKQLIQTGTQNAQTEQKLTTAKEGAVALQQQNSTRTADAQQVQERAAQQRSAIKKEAQQRREQKEDLSQKIAAWAQGHQESRQQAAAQTQAQLEAQGYEINEVKNV